MFIQISSYNLEGRTIFHLHLHVHMNDHAHGPKKTEMICIVCGVGGGLEI